MKRNLLLLVIIVIAFLHYSCDSTKKDWENAKSKSTIEGFNSFMEKHPNSVFEKEARKNLDSLKQLETIKAEWNKLSANFSIENTEIFLGQFPNSPYTQNALNKIDSVSFKNALIESKIKNPLLDTLYLKNLNSSFSKFGNKDLLDLINVLIERFNQIKGSAYLISPIKLAEGKDLAKTLRSSGLESSGTISQEDKNGSKIVVTFKGMLTGNYLDESLMIGTGSYLAKSNVAKINFKGSYSIKQDGEYILFSTYYPKDALYFQSGMEGAKFQLPFGKNTVIRVLGEIDTFFDNIVIKSNETFPIHVILREEGLFYLMGKGEVKVGNSKPLIF
jgi:hypothetical protein